jgi:hypothetical protein
VSKTFFYSLAAIRIMNLLSLRVNSKPEDWCPLRDVQQLLNIAHLNLYKLLTSRNGKRKSAIIRCKFGLYLLMSVLKGSLFYTVLAKRVKGVSRCTR